LYIHSLKLRNIESHYKNFVFGFLDWKMCGFFYFL